MLTTKINKENSKLGLFSPSAFKREAYSGVEHFVPLTIEYQAWKTFPVVFDKTNRSRRFDKSDWDL